MSLLYHWYILLCLAPVNTDYWTLGVENWHSRCVRVAVGYGHFYCELHPCIAIGTLYAVQATFGCPCDARIVDVACVKVSLQQDTASHRE